MKNISNYTTDVSGAELADVFGPYTGVKMTGYVPRDKKTEIVMHVPFFKEYEGIFKYYIEARNFDGRFKWFTSTDGENWELLYDSKPIGLIYGDRTLNIPKGHEYLKFVANTGLVGYWVLKDEVGIGVKCVKINSIDVGDPSKVDIPNSVVPLKISIKNDSDYEGDSNFTLTIDDETQVVVVGSMKAYETKKVTLSMTFEIGKEHKVCASDLNEVCTSVLIPCSKVGYPTVKALTKGDKLIINYQIFNMSGSCSATATIHLFVNDTEVHTEKDIQLDKFSSIAKAFTLSPKPTKVYTVKAVVDFTWHCADNEFTCTSESEITLKTLNLRSVPDSKIYVDNILISDG